MGPGESPAHLENCTGRNEKTFKILRKSSVEAEDSSQKRRRETEHKKGLTGFSIVLGKHVRQRRSSEQERRVDARALIADEGRDKLR